MGMKYASFHIPAVENSGVLQQIIDNWEGNDEFNEFSQSALMKLVSPDEIKIYERMISAYKSVKYLLVTKRFISVYDETLSFETIVETVKKISKKIDLPILYTSNFDDDVFIMGVVQSGKTLCKRNIGPGLSSYELKQLSVKINTMLAIKGFELTGGQKEFLTTDDIDKCQESIDDAYGISIALKESDFNDYENMFELIKQKNDLKVFAVGNGLDRSVNV